MSYIPLEKLQDYTESGIQEALKSILEGSRRDPSPFYLPTSPRAMNSHVIKVYSAILLVTNQMNLLLEDITNIEDVTAEDVKERLRDVVWLRTFRIRRQMISRYLPQKPDRRIVVYDKNGKRHRHRVPKHWDRKTRHWEFQDPP